MARTTPQVSNGILALQPEAQDRAISVGSEAWWRWLAGEDTTAFRYATPDGSFTARRERKDRRWYWYAYRRRGGVLRKVYLGRSEELERTRLDATAALLAAHDHHGEQQGKRPTGAHTSSRGDALLATKLKLPTPPADVVARPRLHHVLDIAAQRALTLISAPAGFGKTTLLSGWLASARRAAWLGLDTEDNDHIRFWTNLIAALQHVQPALGAVALMRLRGEQSGMPEAAIKSLLRALADSPESLIIALDDFHLLTTAAIHESFSYFVEHLPSHVHIVIASRTDPPLPLARLRVRGQLAEIRASDLAFLPDEVASFLAQSGVHLPPDDLADLAARTEGWIAGLKLAALAARDRDDPAALIRSFSGSHRYIGDYLAEEVLRRQPIDVQRFLLCTSILDRLSAPLCDTVLGEWGLGVGGWGSDPLIPNPQNSQTMLEELERSNLFLVPLDEERRWYRYQHLFGSFLRDRLRHAEPEIVPRLHRRAADWYAAHNLEAEAIGHALMAADWDLAATLVARVAYSTATLRGEWATVLRWFDALPEAVTRSRPELCVAWAWALALGYELDRAEAYLRVAERHIRDAVVLAERLRDDQALLFAWLSLSQLYWRLRQNLTRLCKPSSGPYSSCIPVKSACGAWARW